MKSPSAVWPRRFGYATPRALRRRGSQALVYRASVHLQMLIAEERLIDLAASRLVPSIADGVDGQLSFHSRLEDVFKTLLSGQDRPCAVGTDVARIGHGAYFSVSNVQSPSSPVNRCQSKLSQIRVARAMCGDYPAEEGATSRLHAHAQERLTSPSSGPGHGHRTLRRHEEDLIALRVSPAA